MRKTITISVSDEMYELIYQGTRARYYSTVSEYIRFLVRRDQMPDVRRKEDTPRPVNEMLKEVRREMELENESRGFYRS